MLWVRELSFSVLMFRHLCRAASFSMMFSNPQSLAPEMSPSLRSKTSTMLSRLWSNLFKWLSTTLPTSIRVMYQDNDLSSDILSLLHGKRRQVNDSPLILSVHCVTSPMCSIRTVRLPWTCASRREDGVNYIQGPDNQILNFVRAELWETRVRHQ